MSIAVVPMRLSASTTWQQFQKACVCMILAIGVGSAIYAVETFLLESPRRFVENPADVMTRAIGLAHFSIGWLFLFTSPGLRNPAALGRLTFWTLFGVAFCIVFAWGGADKNPLLLLAFYSFFFIHEACDEGYLFRTSGEAGLQGQVSKELLRWLSVTVSLLFITLLVGLQLRRGNVIERYALLQEWPVTWFLAIWLCFALMTIGAILVTIRRARSEHGSLREALLVYQPLVAVYGSLIGILFVGSFFGSIGANLVILVHGMTWLVWTHYKLRERGAEVTGVWSWLRNTPTGFVTLHLALTALALVLFGLRVHVWQRSGFVCDLVSRGWFPYWGIMHIAMSFWRSK